MAHPERVCRICGEAGERMASLVCLAPRNLRQRSRWRRLGVDYLAPTRAHWMGISNGAAKSAPVTADGTRRETRVRAPDPGSVAPIQRVPRRSQHHRIVALDKRDRAMSASAHTTNER